jgi:hypothetical protein
MPMQGKHIKEVPGAGALNSAHEKRFLNFFFFFFVANTFQIQPFHRDWQSRQMWLFVLCQEHSTDINYQCWLHWHPSHVFATLDKLSHGSVIILGFSHTISRIYMYQRFLLLSF